MSRNVVVAKRYAKALFDIAQQQQIVAEVEDQLKLIVQAINSEVDVQKFLALPSVDASRKIELLRGVFADRVSYIVLNTLELLLTNGRQNVISDVYGAYVKIAGESLGQARATVYTAQTLSAEELDKVAAQFSQITGKKITAEQVVEPALLGGIQVRIGDRLYDGSLAGKLNRLQKSLNKRAL
ncbi:ATP synthase F1 subcomplex delta subunit [Paenibacillus cellulosilyticus]|uniref:ATP synthase subunit delta n=1 Tax=Paenibacillus cellulosilyticus TaxID=375489 RepID=A0A2V2Z0V5_9BACL|nr:F0F1 ATP synthase subunit delta [Paenibacillus cellulosilyticus]PWW08422.1 ATP synthase F1 subcomplex delta subunit [Paenibacillus cellulosilyticus]QKS48010.1 F0F1 ATP synthase subunit delta [Paenibacillus cellulosilyticus]